MAQVQIDYICRQTSPKEVRKAMDTLPGKIADYYSQSIRRIDDLEDSEKGLAKKAISYVFSATRPLTVSELLQALSTEADDDDLDECALTELDIVLDLSVGLLRASEQSSTVALIHHTLHQYLTDNPEHLLPNFDLNFARTCLTHMSYGFLSGGPCENVSALEKRLTRYPFLNYACHNLGTHLSHIQLHPAIHDTLLSFLRNRPKLAACIQILYASPLQSKDWHNRYPKSFTGLHLVAQWGLHDFFLLLSSEVIDIDVRDSNFMTALLLAARHGHESIVHTLLQKGAEIDAVNSEGETPLVLAARFGHESIAKLLLAHSANTALEDNHSWTALDWAVAEGHETLVDMLFGGRDKIADDDHRKSRVLCLAADEGHENIIRILLDHGINVNVRDANGSTALDWAVPAGRYNAVKVLLDHGADTRSMDLYGNTVLHWAIRHKALAVMLLDSGAPIDAKNDKGQTALCWAAQDGIIDVVAHLLDKNADANLEDIYGFTPLHRAALRGRKDMVSILLDHGARPEIASDGFWTPLHIAVLKGHGEVIDVLLPETTDGQNILSSMSQQIENPDTVAFFNTHIEKKAEASTVLSGLHAAIQERQFGKTKMLLERGADVNALDPGGWSGLFLAVWNGDLDTMQLLVENGADVDLAGPNQQTPLHCASQYGDDVALKFLVANGASLDTKALGWTPSLLAASEGHLRTLQYLIDKGANSSQKDYHGRTILHWAAKHGSEIIFQMLVDRGADVNAVDRWGRTVLMWAIEHAEGSMIEFDRDMLIQLILDMGVDTGAKAQHGITALHMAAFVGSCLIVRRLLDKGVDLEVEARWCEPQSDWEAEFVALDVKETKYHKLCEMIFDHCKRERADSEHRKTAVHGLRARDVAERTKNHAVEQLFTARSA